MDNENTKVGRKAKNDLYNAAFAVRLRKLFEENNITQANVAEKLGTTRQTIGNWLLGKSQPDFETLVKLADLFETTTDYLLGRTCTKTVDTDIRAVCDYTGLSEKAVDYLKNCNSEWMKYRRIETKLFAGFLNYLIITNFEHDDIEINFSECLLNYYQALKHSLILNLKNLSENDAEKKCLILEELKKQSRIIRYSKIDLNELTADYLEDYLDEQLKFYDETIKQTEKLVKDGEPDGND